LGNLVVFVMMHFSI